MKLRLLSLLLALTLVLSLLPVGVLAADENNIVDYLGMSFNKSTGIIEKCTSSASSLVIPSQIEGETVVGIKAGAFVSSSVGSVTIPDTVGTIGDNAFDGCTSLTTVILQDGARLEEHTSELQSPM